MQKQYGRILLIILLLPAIAPAQQTGIIRGVVYDDDFDALLPAATIQIVETQQEVTASDEGNYIFEDIAPGTYTLVFFKEGYVREIETDVVVSAGQMTEVDARLSGEFVEMEEFIVQDVQIGSGTEIALLELRTKSPALLDSISADLMSQAGAGDVASALKLVAGATVQDGKYATIRGLPDRYVNSQMNSVRLPTADIDKRAVELDQFPSPVIQSVQVSKTFTPDQQGDASGGAVNVVLKGIPEEESLFKFSFQKSYNTQVLDAGDDFLSYKGGGVGTWGMDDGGRDIQKPGTDWGGAVGVSPENAPEDFKWSIATGGKREFVEGFKIGGFGNFYYEKDSSYFDDGIDDQLMLLQAGEPMTPRYFKGAPAGEEEPFYTALFDTTQASQEVKWGGLGAVGVETDNHNLSLTYMYNRTAEDQVTLGENTRGKASLHKYWPYVFGPEFENYDPYDMDHPGNQIEYRWSSPYRRNETLEYTERTSQTWQIRGNHVLFEPDLGIDEFFTLLNPELDWVLALSEAGMYQPDKRLFASYWYPNSSVSGAHKTYRDAETANLGNLQRVWKEISEESNQYSANLKFPFEPWSGKEGYLKFGVFYDDVNREYKQQSFSNFGASQSFGAPWEVLWSNFFPQVISMIDLAEIDVDYEGQQEISAWYYMADFPVTSYLNIIGGARFENTDLSIINFPETKVVWYPTDTGSVELHPGDADVFFKQDDILPSIGFNLSPIESISFRGSYSETIARQTFKELTPIQQLEYLGGDIFIGNPFLKMSALKNYDFRFDYSPYQGGLVSVSYFYKDVTDPIEYVQKAGNGFSFTKPINYPEGELSGYEFEVRQNLGYFWDIFEGLSLGANATFIESEVTLPDDEANLLKLIKFPEPQRDMTNAPEHLYNLFFTYDIESWGTQFGMFYTVRGDTLVAGTGYATSYIPSIYETEYGTLNLSLSQKLWEKWTLKFQAKNLLDPAIETVYRSKYMNNDTVKTSHHKGMEFSMSISATF